MNEARSSAAHVSNQGSGVSVVLATFNGGKYLQDQLDSLSDQDMPPLELIVSDDGSSDDTAELVEKFARVAHFPVFFQTHERAGVCANFMQGAQLAKGKYIAWCDQDDVWLPEKLSTCLGWFDKVDGAVLVQHGAVAVDENLKPVESGWDRVRRVVIREQLRGDLFAVTSGFTMVFRRDLLRDVHYDDLPWSHVRDGAWYHDELTAKLAFISSGRRVAIPDKLALYRQHGTNTAGVLPQLSGRQVLELTGSVYRNRANVLVGWRDFAEAHSRSVEVRDYFTGAVSAQERRARIYEAGTKLGALRNLIAGIVRGDYKPRESGGHGLKSLGRDCIGVFESRTAVN